MNNRFTDAQFAAEMRAEALRLDARALACNARRAYPVRSPKPQRLNQSSARSDLLTVDEARKLKECVYVAECNGHVSEVTGETQALYAAIDRVTRT